MILRFACNGHWLTAEVVRRLVELGAESVTVSLDGSRETHDRLRHGPRGEGPSSFERVIAAIERLKATSIAVEVITAVSRQNLGELAAIHALLKERRVDRWIVQLAHPSGRLAPGRGDGSCQPIAPDDLPAVADFIVQRASDPTLPPRAFNSIGYLSSQEPILRQSGRPERNPLWRGCRCGITHIGVEPDGGVKGCANQVGAPFVVGHIRTEPLRAIWEDRARWHWLNPTPARMAGACAGCALAKFCHAGCTTLAYRSTGRLFDNPYCLRRLERARGAVT
jgi:radical SAM protein with 4Fe4S-binding SPASM domain